MGLLTGTGRGLLISFCLNVFGTTPRAVQVGTTTIAAPGVCTWLQDTAMVSAAIAHAMQGLVTEERQMFEPLAVEILRGVMARAETLGLYPKVHKEL